MLQAGRLLRPQLSAPAPAGRPRVARRRLSCGPLAALGAPSPKSDDDGIVKTRLGYPRLAESQKIHYGEFLDLMRAQEVKEIVFTHEGTERSAVVLKDGGIRYVQIPSDDPRIFDFMSTYGVVATLAPPEPTGPDTATMRFAKDVAMYWTPTLLILFLYGVVQYMARTKGDFEDRVKLRALAEKERKEARERAMKDIQEEEEERLKNPSAAGSPEDSAESARAFMKSNVKRIKARAPGAADGEEEAEEPAKGGAAAQPLDPAAEEERKRKIRARTRSKLTTSLKLRKDERVTFADVAGIGEAKLELQEVVDFFLKPEKFKRSGSRMPKGVLLCGPPGTGKTLLARAVAGEAGADFFSITASEFVEMFVGVGAARVRDLFEQAKAQAPAIVFIDELDAVGRKRGAGGMGGGNDERDQTLNQLLSELDGFDASKGLVVIAATNRPDVLDPALIRPGRFDRKVVVPAPDAQGRLDILKVHMRKKPVDGDVDLHEIANDAKGFTGASLANLVNQAALAAARDRSPRVAQEHLRQALEAELMGKVVAEDTKADHRRRLAVCKAASALAATLLPEVDDVEVVSIVPRESSRSGVIRYGTDDNREATGLHTHRRLRQQIVHALAPQAAEELVYGTDELSVFNEEGLVRARDLANRLVFLGGFGEFSRAVGRRALAYEYEGSAFLSEASAFVVPPFVSDATYDRADGEVARVLQEGLDEAKRILAEHKDELVKLTDALLEKHSLNGEEVAGLLGAKLKHPPRPGGVIDVSTEPAAAA